MLAWLNGQIGDGGSVYVVGGCLRDQLLGRPITDVDIVTDDLNLISELKRAAKAKGIPVVALDEERQIFRLVGEPSVDLCCMQGGSLAADLSSRDFTINALACLWDKWYQKTPEQLEGYSIDYHNGLVHLSQKQLVQVDTKSLSSDPLRVLRLLRFTVQLGFEPNDRTIEQALGTRALLAKVPGERVRVELLKLFCGQTAPYLQYGHWGYSILEAVVPELEIMAACEQNFYHKVNVYIHCWAALDIVEAWWRGDITCWPEDLTNRLRAALEPKLALLKLTALLHDLGKPASRGTGKAGRITFYGHEHRGESLIKQVANRLRFSNKEKAYCAALIKAHMRPLALAKLDKPSGRSVHRLFRDVGELLPDLLVLSMADMLAKQRYNPNREEEREYCQFLKWLAEQWYYHRDEFLPSQPITGRDVLELYPTIDTRQLGSLLLKMNELLIEGQGKTSKTTIIQEVIQNADHRD